MITILATGFDAFPGMEENPSARLVAALERRRAHFVRMNIKLETRVLPVVYEGLAERLARLREEISPDAILHFGVATRRKGISVETCARNRCCVRSADAQGARPASDLCAHGGPDKIIVTLPAAQIAERIRRAGIGARTSRDAGAYLCNATLYETLRAAPHLPAGFIHIPLPARQANDTLQPSFADIFKAAEIAIIAIAAHVYGGSFDVSL